ncbi:MAG: hypothetical protein AB7I27_07705 [Bacteriovoracaceae bacterium]
MKNCKKESGQALIEFIIFLPMMFMLYALVSGFANSINGSINQQKFTRNYFYFRIQNNSTTPRPDSGAYKSWGKFGMFFLGWKKYFINGESPLMPCYKISIPLKAAADDKCDQKYTKPTSQYIRVGTVYGICGATYMNQGNTVYTLPDLQGSSYQEVVDRESCLITR